MILPVLQLAEGGEEKRLNKQSYTKALFVADRTCMRLF